MKRRGATDLSSEARIDDTEAAIATARAADVLSVGATTEHGCVA